MQLGRSLIYLGLVMVAVGVIVTLARKFGLGSLPGDVVIRGKNFTFAIPVVSSIVVSIVLTLLLNLFRK